MARRPESVGLLTSTRRGKEAARRPDVRSVAVTEAEGARAARVGREVRDVAERDADNMGRVAIIVVVVTKHAMRAGEAEVVGEAGNFSPSLLCFSCSRGGGGERSVVLVVGIVAVQPHPPANTEQARATGDGGGEFGRSVVEAEAERVTFAVAAFSSDSGDLLLFSSAGDTLDSSKGPYGYGEDSEAGAPHILAVAVLRRKRGEKGERGEGRGEGERAHQGSSPAPLTLSGQSARRAKVRWGGGGESREGRDEEWWRRDLNGGGGEELWLRVLHESESISNGPKFER
ncbi:hypothetical protein [Oryza sativa Japonica Group]|uniref:Uncharacterized protein n=1 Tax=Oryza sativa subsp. japonica TaxID=39947 RepID=Q5VR27_ORYSJ|nr:hypothetical protein [Oryza sativa Japonica Group]